MIKKKRLLFILALACVAFFGTYKAFSMRSIYKVRSLIDTINKIENVKNNGISFSVSDYKPGLFHSTCVISEKVNTITSNPPVILPFTLDIYNGPIIIHHGLNFKSAILISALDTRNNYQIDLHTDVAYFRGYDIKLLGKYNTEADTTINNDTKPSSRNTLKVTTFDCNLHLPKISKKTKPKAALSELTAAIDLNDISGKISRPKVQYAINAKNIHIDTDMTKKTGKITATNLILNRNIINTRSEPHAIELKLKNVDITNLHMSSDEMYHLISNKSLQKWAINLTNLLIKKETQKQSEKESKNTNQTQPIDRSSHVADSLAKIISNKTQVNINGIELMQHSIKLHGNIKLSWPQLKNKHSFQDVFTDAKFTNTLEPSFIEPTKKG